MGFVHNLRWFFLFFVASLVVAGCSEARMIDVGGSEKWREGYNYTDWALKTRPFFVDDVLVFKYDPPSEGNNASYNIYLLPNWWSYEKCEFKKGKMLANESRGSGEGFSYVLKQTKALYFASGENGGAQCKYGMMKFSILPLPPWN